MTAMLTIGTSARADSDSEASGPTHVLKAGEELLAGDSLYSPSKMYKLTMEISGNLVLYAKAFDSWYSVWSTGTSLAGASLQMQEDGDLLIFTGTQSAWHSNTGTAMPGRNYYLAVTDNGTLVIHGESTVRFVSRGGRTYGGFGPGDDRSAQLCIAANGANTSDGTQILMYRCQVPDLSQTFVYNWNNDLTIRPSKDLGKCVDINGGVIANGKNITLWSCSSGYNNQKFLYNQATGEIQSFANPSYCLDITGANFNDGAWLELYQCNGGSNQKFSMIQDSGAPLWINPIVLTKRSQPGKCMDIAGGSTADGTNIWLWDCNAGSAQQFIYNRVEGTLRMRAAPNKCVEVANGQTGNGTNVQLGTCNLASLAQQFYVDFAQGRFASRLNGSKCLDINGGNYSSGNGTNIQLYDCNTSTAQQFELDRQIQRFSIGLFDMDDDLRVYVNGQERYYGDRATTTLPLLASWLHPGNNYIEFWLGNKGCWASSLTGFIFRNDLPLAVVDRRYSSSTPYNGCSYSAVWRYNLNATTGEITLY